MRFVDDENPDDFCKVFDDDDRTPYEFIGYLLMMMRIPMNL